MPKIRRWRSRVRLSRRFLHIQTQSLKKIVLPYWIPFSDRVYLSRVMLFFSLSSSWPNFYGSEPYKSSHLFYDLCIKSRRVAVLSREITSTFFPFFLFFVLFSHSRGRYVLPLARIRRNSFAPHSRTAVSASASLRCSFVGLSLKNGSYHR